MNEEELVPNVFVGEKDDNVEISETTTYIEITPQSPIQIISQEAFPPIGDDNEHLYHERLYGKDTANQHPITAITGLDEELKRIKALQVIESNEQHYADYYMWYDENENKDVRDGYFVAMHTYFDDKDKYNRINICTKSDNILGVTIPIAGFVGGQSDIARDYKYGLVAYSGSVPVRCETNVVAGDYVTSNNYGMATKVDSNYGYYVSAISNVGGINYAIVTLTPSTVQMRKLAEDSKDLKERMDNAEVDITAAINIANDAYNKAVDVENMIGTVSGEVSDKIDDINNKVDGIVGDLDRIDNVVQNSNESAVLAQTIAENAVSAAEAIRDETIDTTNQALLEVIATREEAKALRDEAITTANQASANAQRAKDEVIAVRDEMNAGIIEAKGTTAEAVAAAEEAIQQARDARDELEALALEMKPLTQWPDYEGADPIGISGFVSQSNENGSTLAQISQWKSDTVTTIAGIQTTASEQGASIDLVTSYLRTKSKTVPNFNDIVNPDQTMVYYCQTDKLYYYWDEENNEWVGVSTAEEAGLSESLAAIQQQADANSSNIALLATWQSDQSDPNQVGTVAYINAKADSNSAKITNLTSFVSKTYIKLDEPWDVFKRTEDEIENIYYALNPDDENNYYYYYYMSSSEVYTPDGWTATTSASIAGLPESVALLQQKSDENSAQIAAVAQKSNENAESIASISQSVSDNDSEISLLASHIRKQYKGVDNFANEVNPDIGLTYYCKATKKYYYYDNDIGDWVGTTDPYEAGLSGSIAGIQVQSDANGSRIDSLTSYVNKGYIVLDVKWSEANIGADGINNVYYAADDDGNYHYYYYDNGWKSTDSASEAGLVESITAIQQQSDKNSARIDSLTSYVSSTCITINEWVESDRTEEDRKNVYYVPSTKLYYYFDGIWRSTTEASIAGLSEAIAYSNQRADANGAQISDLVEWKSDQADESKIGSIAYTLSKATANESAIIDIVKREGETATTIASIQDRVDGESARIDSLTSYVDRTYEKIDPPWSESGKDKTKVYYVETEEEVNGETQTIGRYYYTDDAGNWQNTTDASEAGLIESLAYVKQLSTKNESSINNLVSWQGETNTSLASLETTASENGAMIRGLVIDMNKYVVAEKSPRYRLTQAEAEEIIESGTVYVPLGAHGETYDDDITFYFEKGGYYTWNGTQWNESSTVIFSTSYISGNSQRCYWVLQGNDITRNETIGGKSVAVTYFANKLYKWENSKWNVVASIYDTATRSLIQQTSNEIMVSVNGVNGNVASLATRVGTNESNITSITSNVSSLGSSLATIQQTTGTNESKIASIVQNIGSDGQVTTASIIQHVNGADSTIQLNADKINFISKAFQIYPSDGSGTITNTTTPNFQVTNTGDVTIKGKITSESGKIGGWNISANEIWNSKAGINTSDDYTKDSLVTQGSTSPVRFYCGNGNRVDGKFVILDDGSLYAAAAKIAGSIQGETIKLLTDADKEAGHIQITGADSSTYAVELGSGGALRLLANYGDVFIQGGANHYASPYIQLHDSFDSSHISVGVAYSGSDSTHTWGFEPAKDNTMLLGKEDKRWKEIYLTTSPSVTSDRREKQNIEYNPEKYDEFFNSLKPTQYKFVEGTSDRYHIGFISQDIEQSIIDCGLTSQDFAGFIKSPLYENDSKESNIVDYKYGLRYEEFIALNTHMIQKLYKRIEELEKKLNG